jgi:hypothetical protein
VLNNGISDYELEIVRKEVVLASFEVLSRYFCGWTEEGNKKHQSFSKDSIFGMKSEPATSRI